MSKKNNSTAGTTSRFWLVWNAGGGAPTKKHLSAASAKKEAERLSAANPDQHFAVLQAMEVYVARVNPPQALRCVTEPASF